MIRESPTKQDSAQIYSITQQSTDISRASCPPVLSIQLVPHRHTQEFHRHTSSSDSCCKSPKLVFVRSAQVPGGPTSLTFAPEASSSLHIAQRLQIERRMSLFSVNIPLSTIQCKVQTKIDAALCTIDALLEFSSWVERRWAVLFGIVRRGRKGRL